MNKIVIQYLTHQGFNTEKQPKRNEPPISENGNTSQQHNPQPTNPEQTLKQEQKLNLEYLKRIMGSGKTTLPSLRNTEWKTIKTETNRINQVITYISTNNITE